MWDSDKMSQNGKKGHKKQSGCDVTKSLKVTMEQNITIFMGKMDVKYVWMKCSHGTKCHTVGLPKNVWTECSAVTFCPPINVQNEMFGGGRTISPP